MKTGRPRRELAGQRFGLLTVIRPYDRRNKQWSWLCQCDCGRTVVIVMTSLVQGDSRSCGCRQGTHIHDQSRTQLYHTWKDIRQRCNNPNDKAYRWYGGKGVKLCEEWSNDYMAFRDYIGPRPSPKHSLDRYPNRNGNYELGNVRWATQKQQANNRRKRSAWRLQNVPASALNEKYPERD